MSITLSSVAKSFGADRALDGVSLDIGDGAFFAVLGPSGCGKSTLLRLTAGLETLDAGEIRIGGRLVAGDGLHVPPETRNVGVVFQSYALWPHMSVEANVAFPLGSAGTKRGAAAARAREHLSTVELQAFADRKPAQLSGGQRQRVALARCLAQNAGTILMDEPLANLDPHLRASMEEEIQRFHARAGATVLYITHDQREAMALADRLAVMWDGRILQVGEPDAVYHRPVNERVARFIGRGAVLEGAVLRSEAGRARVRIAGFEADARCLDETTAGPTKLMVRPDDIAVGNDPGSMTGTIERVAYRGGFWEAAARVEGLGEPLALDLPRRVGVGDTVPVTLRSAWVLPEI